MARENKCRLSRQMSLGVVDLGHEAGMVSEPFPCYRICIRRFPEVFTTPCTLQILLPTSARTEFNRGPGAIDLEPKFARTGQLIRLSIRGEIAICRSGTTR